MTIESFILPKPLLKALGQTEHDDDLRTIIVDLAAAGRIHGYAHSVDDHYHIDHQPDANCGVTVEQWRRIIHQGLVEEVWERGTVRLASDVKNHQYYVEIVGIRFLETQVRAALADFGLTFMAEPLATLEVESPAIPKASPLTQASAKGPGKKSKNQKLADDPNLFTVDQGAAYIGVGKTKYYDLQNSGEIEFYMAGVNRITERVELDRWINSKKVRRAPPPPPVK